MWPYGSTTYTYSVGFPWSFNSMPSLTIYLAEYQQIAATRVDVRLAASYPLPSTTTTGKFSISSKSTGHLISIITVRCIAYLPTALSSNFSIINAEMASTIALPAGGSYTYLTNTDYKLTNAHLMLSTSFLYGVQVESATGDLMVRPVPKFNSTSLTGITVYNTLNVSMVFDFVGVVVVACLTSNDLGTPNTFWLQSDTLTSSTASTDVGIFGNSLSWFTYTPPDYVDMMGVSEIERSSLASGMFWFKASRQANMMTI